MEGMEPIAIKIEDAVKLTNIGRKSLEAMMEDPRFPVFKIGNRTIIPVEGLKKYINNLGLQRYGLV